MMKTLSILIACCALGLASGFGVRYLTQPSAPTLAERTGDYAHIQQREQADVVLYSLPGCDACKRARTWLQDNNIAFAELDIAASEAARAESRSLGAKTVPLILIGTRSVEGFDPARWHQLLQTRRPFS